MPYRSDRSTKPKLAREQKFLLNSIAQNVRTTCVSGHGTGKTSGLGFGTLWFLGTRPNALVVVSAPKADQIRDTLWTEINRWLVYSPLRFWFQWMAEKVVSRLSPEDWYAVARTAKEPQNLAGFHADHLLFIVDEAGGVRDEIYEVIEGALTGPDNRLVLASQGISTTGYFFDSHHKDRMDWNCLVFNSEESELANPAYAARIARKYGRDSDIYRVRVLGQFPKGNKDAFIQYDEVLKAQAREVDIVKNAPFEVGVDVSRGGDDLTVLAIRQGNLVFPLRIYPGSIKDLVKISEYVVEAVRDYRRLTGYRGPVRVKVDDTGVGGGVTDILKRDKENILVVIGVNFSSGVDDPVDSEYYDNMVSMMWGELRDQLPHISLPDDEFLAEELHTRRTVPGRGGLTRIEPKDRFKRDYGASPDRADALILAFTKQAEKKRVVPGFSHYNDKVCRDFKINWRMMEKNNAKVYASIHQEENLTTSIVLSLWDGIDGKLWIFEELVASAPRPELIMPRLQQKLDSVTHPENRQAGFKMNMKKFLWHGNNAMFGLSEKATSFKGMRDGSANSFMVGDMAIGIMPNLYYDEPGSIAQTGRLFAGQHITVHTRCENLVKDLEEWYVQTDKIESGSGLCMALCNIANMLFQQNKIDFKKKKLKPYSPQKAAILAELQRADRDGTLEEYDKNIQRRLM